MAGATTEPNGSNETALKLVRERPADTFQIFHVYLDASIVWEAEGQTDRVRFALDLTRNLAMAYAAATGSEALTDAVARYQRIRQEQARVDALRQGIELMRRADDCVRRKEPCGVRAASEALRHFTVAGEFRGQARAQHLLAGAQLEDGNLDDAVTTLRDAIDNYQKSGDVFAAPRAMAQLSSYLEEAGRNDEAIDARRESLHALERTGARDDALQARLDLARQQIAAGRPRLAQPHLRICSTEAMANDNPSLHAMAFSLRVNAHVLVGEYPKAIRLLVASLRNDESDDHSAARPASLAGNAGGARLGRAPGSRAHRLLQLAGVYSELGLYDRARARLAELFLTPGVDHATRLAAVTLHARVALDCGLWQEAETNARTARDESAPDSHSRAEAERLLGLSLLSNSDARGIEHLEAARRLSPSPEHALMRGLCEADLADAERRRGANEAAKTLYLQALTSAKAFPEVAWRCHAGLGELFERRGETKNAQHAYERAIGIQEELLKKIGSTRLRRGFFEGRERPYHRLLNLLLSSKRPLKALEVAQRLQARGTVWHRGQTTLSTPARFPNNLAESAETTLLELEACRRAAERSRNDRTQARLRSRRELLRSRFEDLLASVEEHGEVHEALGGFRPARLDRIFERLRGTPSAAVLVYAVTEESTHLWTLWQGRVKTHPIPATRTSLDKRIERLRKPYREFRDGRVDLTHLSWDTRLARELYDLLLAPAAAHLEAAQHIYIVPDGPLHELPFEALVSDGTLGRLDHRCLFKEYRECTYVLDHWAVSYLPSLRHAESLEALRLEPEARALVIANPDAVKPIEVAQLRTRRGGPLPSASIEAEAIEQILGSTRVRTLLGSQASFRSLREHVGDTQIVHFATHAWIEPTAPLYSTIQMAPTDEGRDLEAHAIRELPWEGRFVVLSACETAAGPRTPGVGPASLAREFLHAGARGVLASHWRVDASAARLMQSFYEALRNGAPAAKALRRAKLHLLREAQQPQFSYALPYFWAPFTLTRGHGGAG